MTPEQKIKQAIMFEHVQHNGTGEFTDEITRQNVDEVYDEMMVSSDFHWDAESEFRESGVDTNLPCGFSRNYESKSVAKQMLDGSWVGWTYWFGGGKHGEPDAVEWMEDAYDVKCSEEKKMVTVRTFAATA